MIQIATSSRLAGLGRIVAIVSWLLVGASAADSVAGTASSCTLEDGGRATVARVIDGETVQLDTLREVRLIGALAPRARDADAAADAWPPEQAAMAALSALTLGKRVRLAYGGRRADRYGRALAHLFVESDGEETWVQGHMLEHGHARAYGLEGSFACGGELLAHEAVARRERAGLWSNRAYRPLPAARPSALMRARGHYALVHGTVRKVAVTKSAIYLNFGFDWRSDFTVRVPHKASEPRKDLVAFASGLEGKRVAVRGWIERRNGPTIDVLDISQVELLDASQELSEPGPREPDLGDTDRARQSPAAADGVSPDPKAERPPASGAKRTGDLDL